MTPFILILGVSIFVVCLGLHVLIWWRRHPKSHIIALALIFIVVPTVVGIIGLGLNWLELLPKGAGIIPISISDWPLVFLLHYALAGAYIMSYPAVQAVSPSLTMLLIVGSAAPRGLTYDELRSHFNSKELLQARLHDLKEGSLAVEVDGWFRLTWRGLLLIRFTGFLRSLLGLPQGKG